MVVVLAAVLIYLPALRGPLLWDDELIIKKNPSVTSPAHFGELWVQDVEASGGKKGSLYRPLVVASFALDYGLWRANPVGYHAENLLWHIAASLAVFCVAFALFDSVLPAFLACILFCVHPVHTEAVSYISGRSDPMSAFFLLGVFYVYIKRPLPAVGNLALIAGGTAACLLSRESGLILPGFILLYHAAFRKRIDRLSFFAVAAVAAAYVAVRLTVLRPLLPHAPASVSFPARLPAFFAAFGQYLCLLVWPADLHMEYGTVFFRPSDPLVVAGFFLFLAAAGCLILAARRSRVAAFGAGWFLIGLLPFANIVPLNAYMAEHWLYVPSVGLFLLAGRGLSSLITRPRLKMLGLGSAAALAAFYGAVTFIHNRYWSDPVYFYERTFRYTPGSWRVANNLGTIYQEKGDLGKAEAFLLRAVALKGDVPETHNNLGIVYSRRDELEKAVASFNKALALRPGYVEAYCNMGNAFRRAGRTAQAEEAYHQALGVRPDAALAYAGLGDLAQDAGSYKEAEAFYQKALDIDPGCVEAYNNLGAVKQKSGKEDALQFYREAIERDPDNPDAYVNMALAYQQAGRYEEARKVYEKLFSVDPNNASGYNNMGSLLQATGREDEALAAYEKAIALDPKFVNAYFNLGNLYRRRGRVEDAVKMYEQATALGTDSIDARINLGAVYQMSGRPERAAEMYRQVLKDHPDSLEATMNLALILWKSGDIAEAEAYYEKAIALQPDNASIYNNFGLMLKQQNSFGRAEKAFRKAISVDPKFAEAYNNLAVLCLMSGRKEEALEALKEAVAADPRYAQGYYNLAVFYAGQGDRAAGRQYLDKAKELGFPVDARLEADLGEPS
ncbi:MAG: tetratricopeptide repeat protein [Deltaproteobacteria bacterium]